MAKKKGKSRFEEVKEESAKAAKVEGRKARKDDEDSDDDEEDEEDEDLDDEEDEKPKAKRGKPSARVRDGGAGLQDASLGDLTEAIKSRLPSGTSFVING